MSSTSKSDLIPSSLDEWTLDVVRTLLHQGYHESERFDFKEALPHSKDVSAKERMRRTCAAFANSEGGGYLLFGIDDDSAKSPADRLVGIAKTLDVPEHFGVYPQQCRPTVAWRFKNPPLDLDGQRVIHVVEIPRSWYAPHAVMDEGGALLFPKRTNKGNEIMSYEEVRMGFLNYYEKRIQLQLLFAELESIIGDAAGLIVRDDIIDKSFSLNTFDLTVLDSVLASTYTLLASNPHLVRLLSHVRNHCRLLNTRLRVFHSRAVLPLSNSGDATREHNMAVRDAVARLLPLATEARDQLGLMINEGIE
jgi:Putative DNA-binding domain